MVGRRRGGSRRREDQGVPLKERIAGKAALPSRERARRPVDGASRRAPGDEKTTLAIACREADAILFQNGITFPLG